MTVPVLGTASEASYPPTLFQRSVAYWSEHRKCGSAEPAPVSAGVARKLASCADGSALWYIAWLRWDMPGREARPVASSQTQLPQSAGRTVRRGESW